MAESKDGRDRDLWHSKIEDSERNKISEQIFERLYHAEIHYNRDSKYDIPFATISFANTIELSFACYRPQDDGKKGFLRFEYIAPFFFEDEIIASSGVQYFYDNISEELKMFDSYRGKNYPKNDKTANLSDYIIHLHELRNEYYHRLDSDVVHESVQYKQLAEIETQDARKDMCRDTRTLAIWIFAITFGFNYEDIEKELSKRISKDKQLNNLPILISQQDFKTTSDEAKTNLTTAFLIGKWDDGNPDDLEIISEFTDE